MNDYRTQSHTLFRQSYTTGSDSWTKHSFTEEVLSFARMIPHKSTVLDLGSGRGNHSYLLADLGHKVIGLDFVDELTQKNNQEVKERGYAGKVAFMTGSIFDIPLRDGTLDAVTDFGTLQHIHPNDWGEYRSEVKRVLKPRGFLLLVELSRHTESFLNIKPKESDTGNFDIYGLHYHFFTKKEIEGIFGDAFNTVRTMIFTFPEINNQSYIFTLLQKK